MILSANYRKSIKIAHGGFHRNHSIKIRIAMYEQNVKIGCFSVLISDCRVESLRNCYGSVNIVKTI